MYKKNIISLILVLLTLVTKISAKEVTDKPNNKINISVLGTVSSHNKIVVVNMQNGYVTQLANLGDIVKKGDRLVQLHDEYLNLSIEIKAKEYSRLKKEISYQTRLLDRTKNLYIEKVTPLQAVEDIELKIQLLNLNKEKSSLELKSLQHAFDELLIKAPFDGVVTQRFTSINQYEFEKQNLLEFMGQDKMYLDIFLPKKYLSSLSKNSQLEVISRFGRFVLPLENIIPSMTPDTLMFKIRTLLPRNDWFDNERLKVNIAIDI